MGKLITQFGMVFVKSNNSKSEETLEKMGTQGIKITRTLPVK